MKPAIITPRYPDVDIMPDGGWSVGQTFTVRDALREFNIQKGERVNFLSLPPPLRMFYKTHGKASVAAVVHDVLYHTKQFPKAYTDRLFYRMMLDYGVRPSKAWLFYVGVRGNLWAAWKW